MHTRNPLLGILAALLLYASPSSAARLPNAGGGWAEPPGKFFPGKYFQAKAQFYLKKKDYHEALRLFELAGFWADKLSQYNAGLMHYRGIGVPVNRALGTAWLGIAAESSDELPLIAVSSAYENLSDEEKAQATRLFTELDAKYGDAVALPRALERFTTEARGITGSHVGAIGSLTVTEEGSEQSESGVAFMRRQNQARDDLIAKIQGRVTVGALQPLKVPTPDISDPFPAAKEK